MGWNEGQNRLRGSLDSEQGKGVRAMLLTRSELLSRMRGNLKSVSDLAQIVIVIFSRVFEIEYVDMHVKNTWVLFIFHKTSVAVVSSLNAGRLASVEPLSMMNNWLNIP